MQEVPTERLCRLNGKQPTMREKWTAFYRLYRTAKRDDPRGNADECWQMLMSNWGWIRLVNAGSDMHVDLGHVPDFLRRRLVENHREIRLRDNAEKLLNAIFAEDD